MNYSFKRVFVNTQQEEAFLDQQELSMMTVDSTSTVIPNLGTGGSDYDIASNNVPSEWFNV